MKLNVLVLMAGPGGSFEREGYAFPKNLFEIMGKPLIEHVLQSLKPLKAYNPHLVCAVKKEENERFYTSSVIQLIQPDALAYEVTETAGAACTALLGVEYINNDDPLVIVNGDQVLQADLKAAIDSFRKQDLDGGIIVFEGVHPRWSFVKCGADGLVVEAAEKRPISQLATAGFYYFKQGKDFVASAMSMISKDAHVSELFYICPSYNEMILQQKRIGIYKVEKSEYFPLTSPKEVKEYESALGIRKRDTHNGGGRRAR